MDGAAAPFLNAVAPFVDGGPPFLRMRYQIFFFFANLPCLPPFLFILKINSMQRVLTKVLRDAEVGYGAGGRGILLQRRLDEQEKQIQQLLKNK